MIIQILQFLLSLSILVVLHEFGHYITAKMFGCRVEKFYLFMDWPYALFKKKIGVIIYAGISNINKETGGISLKLFMRFLN